MQKKMISYGIGIPSRRSVWKDYFSDPTPPKNKKVVEQTLPYLKSQYMFPKVAEADSCINEETQYYFLGLKTLEQVTEKAKKRVDNILNKK